MLYLIGFNIVLGVGIYFLYHFRQALNKQNTFSTTSERLKTLNQSIEEKKVDIAMSTKEICSPAPPLMVANEYYEQTLQYLKELDEEIEKLTNKKE